MIGFEVGAWFTAIGRAAWEGGLALVLAWGLIRLAPGIPPAFRCWIWRLVYLKLLIALCWTAPLRVPLLPPEKVAVPAVAASSKAAPPPVAALSPGSEQQRDPAPAPSPGAPALAAPLLGVLFGLWLLGVSVCTAALFGQWRRLCRLRRASRQVEDAELLHLRTDLCRALGIRAEPPLVYSDQVERPMLVGIRHPVVVLPLGFVEGCSAHERRLVLGHELVHLRRRDLHWECLRIAVHTLFFFHPLVRLVDAEWRVAQELACDEGTLRITAAAPGDYGRLLLRVATAGPVGQPAAGPSLGMGESHASLRRRLCALGSFHPLAPAQAAAATFGVILLALTGVVPWRAVAASPVSYLDLRGVANGDLDEPVGGEYKPGNDLAALPRGEQVFAGYRFQVEDRYVQLAGKLVSGPPVRTGAIRVDRAFSTIAVLHGTVRGNAAPGEAHHVADGTRIGEYTVHYADGSREVIPVVYGQDVRDWWIPRREEAAVRRGRLAWTGRNQATRHTGFPGIRLYVTAWTNPRPQAKVSHIEFASANTLSAPFCLALTCGD